MSQTTSNLSSVSQKPKTKPTKLYKLCPACKELMDNSPKQKPETLYRLCPTCGGAGQVQTLKALALQFLGLPCSDCRLLRVVPVEDEP